MRKTKPKHESNQAVLARVKEEMNKPRTTESAREDEDKGMNKTSRQGFKKLV
jgi:hypothetical protein